ncbi:MAG: hypothetical protein A2583_10690 [Bdellovibrionales bacterium RIFOXYD1_FULL_53_11]|nr:MAG: hypothetical protein A2583_10690 [Bdellovibrionales bacterium RIFOXYD1_FULL_53_11]
MKTLLVLLLVVSAIHAAPGGQPGIVAVVEDFSATPGGSPVIYRIMVGEAIGSHKLTMNGTSVATKPEVAISRERSGEIISMLRKYTISLEARGKNASQLKCPHALRITLSSPEENVAVCVGDERSYQEAKAIITEMNADLTKKQLIRSHQK